MYPPVNAFGFEEVYLHVHGIICTVVYYIVWIQGLYTKYKTANEEVLPEISTEGPAIDPRYNINFSNTSEFKVLYFV